MGESELIVGPVAELCRRRMPLAEIPCGKGRHDLEQACMATGVTDGVRWQVYWWAADRKL